VAPGIALLLQFVAGLAQDPVVVFQVDVTCARALPVIVMANAEKISRSLNKKEKDKEVERGRAICFIFNF